MSDTMVATVGPKGRLVLPVALRRRHGWDEGATLLFIETEAGTLITTRDQALADLRRQLAGPSLAEELVTQRRTEADQDLA
ncbi:MAG: AbrB/MazE/SpoVT family DNA-binding domain-containing protein [Micrococcales bacterium]|nr:AbrB/MazE/SpoVT family DNA-binding domain-containing protein [Micrococcales bacterium]